MNVKRRIPDSAKKFHPIIIEIETEAEAYALWNRLNIPSKQVSEVTSANVRLLTKVENQMMYRLDDYYSPED